MKVESNSVIGLQQLSAGLSRAVRFKWAQRSQAPSCTDPSIHLTNINVNMSLWPGPFPSPLVFISMWCSCLVLLKEDTRLPRATLMQSQRPQEYFTVPKLALTEPSADSEAFYLDTAASSKWIEEDRKQVLGVQEGGKTEEIMD
ncbi:hypothetical protein WMY93_002712 [Mugilogobius chulae]|uniref:Uncharacterized protein n=1 Tax=Mugilogobius chulae TaxID=88201 RepID=A0AAW0PUI6_9GOBI